ncbi:subtilisin-like protease Glyma18g48580 [Vicia villosa]|uniref:subtilisin-like protease Glyma18g48580 n=1 Tax=Vicia villosa TaxID=3911 RepID=UPI00273A875C|nr:subtilisin-like protease Glyma18g48580 [Vicia villosa]
MLQEEEAAQIAKNEKVVSVFLIKEHKLHTTRSWHCVKTARDFVGHGTHTLSRLATCKVCWSLTDATSCFGADVLAAIDQAINDGVDLISVSAGESTGTNSEEVFTDVVSIGAFHALARNILLVASSGNDGPTTGSVVNVAPWVFTAASSKTVREGKIKSVSEPHVLSTVSYDKHPETHSNVMGWPFGKCRHVCVAMYLYELW